MLQLSKKDDLAGNDPVALAFKLPPPGARAAANDGGDGTGLTDDDIICTCIAFPRVRSAKLSLTLKNPMPQPANHLARFLESELYMSIGQN